MNNSEVTTGGPTSSAMDAEAGTRRRRRRRARTWLAFGLVGLIMGVVWAVGIATSTAVVDTAGAAPAAQVFGTADPAAGTSQYAGLVSENSALTIGFTGSWGRVDADTGMFDVNLTSLSGTYFVAVYLNNNATGWSVLQLEFRQVNKTCAAALAADWAAPAATSVMVVETEDSWAIFPSLTSGVGANYCFGIQAITPKANDEAGTYIRRPGSGSSPTAPVFIGLLNRSA
ncbi:MAG: hypothetical protein V3V29_05035 [Acidimicrobiia bacterium]